MSDPPASPPFKDRSAGLVLFGALQIGLGCLCALLSFAPLLQLTPAFRQQLERMGQPAPPLRAVLTGTLTYLTAALFFIWTGVGAIAKRRWVRPIMLCATWFQIFAGFFGLGISVFIGPRILAAVRHDVPNAPPGVTVIVAIMMALVLGVAFFLIPLVLLLFYRSPHVKATLEARDRVRRWTDACPTPVLGLSLFLMLGAAGSLLACTYGAAPVFTLLLTGPLGVGLLFALAAVYLALARAAYRLQPLGWWGALVFLTLMTASGATFFATADTATYFATMGIQGEQARMLADSGLVGGPVMPGFLLIGLSVMIGYLLWIRRYFAPLSAAGAAGSANRDPS